MAEPSQHLFLSLIRACRLALHLLHGALLAVFFPLLNDTRQLNILKTWSSQLLSILNISILSDGMPASQAGTGCMMIANHVSWLDIFVLNEVCPARFIAKSEVRSWPLIGWLCQRSGTIFIERTLRRDAAVINRQISVLLEQGVCVGLFPEGTTTDGTAVGQFHASLIQPAVDAGVPLWPVALRYQDQAGGLCMAATFTGDTTLAASIWRILRSGKISAAARFTPALATTGIHRRELARNAQRAIAHELSRSDMTTPEPSVLSTRHRTSDHESCIPIRLSTQSAYVLLLDPVLNQMHK